MKVERETVAAGVAIGGLIGLFLPIGPQEIPSVRPDAYALVQTSNYAYYVPAQSSCSARTGESLFGFTWMPVEKRDDGWYGVVKSEVTRVRPFSFKEADEPPAPTSSPAALTPPTATP